MSDDYPPCPDVPVALTIAEMDEASCHIFRWDFITSLDTGSHEPTEFRRPGPVRRQ